MGVDAPAAKPLPRTAPAERFAAFREVLDKPSFFAALDGAGVLVRLDERGGDDEPAPWAFHGSGLPLPVEVPSGDDEVFVDREPPMVSTDNTVTGPAFSLSIPPARGQATVHVIPKRSEVVLGRDPTSDVQVPERSVSKTHARITLSEPSAEAGPGSRARPNASLTDLGSQNGTRINGHTLPAQRAHVLLSGDVIDLGDVSLLFLDPAGFYDGLPRLTSG